LIEPFLEWIVDVLNSNNPELVHSISYGDEENSLSVEYMYRCEYEFQKAAGISQFPQYSKSIKNSDFNSLKTKKRWV
jgi:hypothetical protein